MTSPNPPVIVISANREPDDRTARLLRRSVKNLIRVSLRASEALGPAHDLVDNSNSGSVQFIQFSNALIGKYLAKLRAVCSLGLDAPIPLECGVHVHPVESVDLSGKSYSPEGAAGIAVYITSPTIALGIVSANLSDIIRGIMDTDDALSVIGSFCDALTSSPLADLDMSCNAVGEKAIGRFVPLLEVQRNLQTLNLRECGFSESSMHAVVAALIKSGSVRTLVKVDLSENNCGDGGGRAIAQLLNNMTSLTWFAAEGLRLNYQDSDYVAAALRDMVTNGRAMKIEHLGLKDCLRLSEEGQATFVEFLGKNEGLRCLDISYNEAGDAAVAEILRAVQESGAGAGARSTITHLILSNTDITDDCADAIADFIKKAPYIQELKLDDNQLGTAGVATILAALSENSPKLEVIDLSENLITDAAPIVAAYGPQGKSFPNLKSIHLDENKFPDDSVQALVAAFGDTLIHMQEPFVQEYSTDEEEGRYYHGTDDEGTSDDGTSDDGTSDDGISDDGTNDDGTNDDGTVAALTEQVLGAALDDDRE